MCIRDSSGGGKHRSGSENEVWSYGEEVLEICTKYLQLRERLRPYVTELMQEAHEKGTPIKMCIRDSSKAFTQYEFSQGSTIAMILFACLFLVGLFYLRLLSKEDD